MTQWTPLWWPTGGLLGYAAALVGVVVAREAEGSAFGVAEGVGRCAGTGSICLADVIRRARGLIIARFAGVQEVPLHLLTGELGFGIACELGAGVLGVGGPAVVWYTALARWRGFVRDGPTIFF